MFLIITVLQDWWKPINFYKFERLFIKSKIRKKQPFPSNIENETGSTNSFVVESYDLCFFAIDCERKLFGCFEHNGCKYDLPFFSTEQQFRFGCDRNSLPFVRPKYIGAVVFISKRYKNATERCERGFINRNVY